jgi:hypothetical protein
MKPIRVLSCFDGHSGGRIALAEDTQLYKMFGNGWTIEVIKHILKPLLTIKQFNN